MCWLIQTKNKLRVTNGEITFCVVFVLTNSKTVHKEEFVSNAHEKVVNSSMLRLSMEHSTSHTAHQELIKSQAMLQDKKLEIPLLPFDFITSDTRSVLLFVVP